MKKNGVALIIIFIVILLAGLFGVLYLKYGNIELGNDTPVIEKKYGVVSTATISGDNLYSSRVHNDFYIVDSNDKCGVVDGKNEVVVPFEYTDCIFVDDYVIAKKNNKEYALNMKNEIIFETDNDLTYMENSYDKTRYYLVLFKNKIDIYDSNFNFLKTINERTYLSFYDKYVVGDEYIYRLDNDEKIKFGNVYFNGDYFVFDIRKKTGYEVYNAKTKELVHYADKKENEYAMTFINQNEKLIIDYEGNVVEDGDKQKVLDKYYLDYSVCKDGFALFDLDKNKLSNICYSTYYEETLEYGALFLFSYDDQIYDLVTPDGEIVSFESDEAYVSGKSLRVWNLDKTKYEYYDLSGNEVEEVCSGGLDYIKDDRYICYNYVSSYVVDEKRNVINGPYNAIICNDKDVCLISDIKGKFGVLHNDIVIVEPSFSGGTIDNDIVVLNGLEKNYVLKFGVAEKLLSKEELVYEEKFEIPYDDINIDEIINEYSLNNMATIIKDNEELFKKYASIVLDNEKIGKYKKDVLNMFNVLVDQKENLEEEYFFSALTRLSLSDVKEISTPGAAGVYYDSDKRIELLVNSHSVITHELMHFFDFNINNSTDNNIYLCNDKYYSKTAVLELGLKEQQTCHIYSVSNNFIVESGAEVNSNRYSNGAIDAYVDAVEVYNALAYIYGEEFMESVYFSKDGDYQLFKKLTQYITPEEYVKFLDSASVFTNINAEYDVNNSKVVAETLVTLYEKTIGGNWYEDKEFLFIINFIVSNYDMTIYDFETEYLTDRMTLLNGILSQCEGEYYERVSISGTVINNGKTYLNIPVWHKGQEGYLKLVYDFDEEKILEIIDFYPENY